MSRQSPISEFLPFLDAACDGTLIETQYQELTAFLESDPAVRRVFIDHVRLRTNIQFLARAERARDLAFTRIRATSQTLPHSSSYPAITFLDSAIYNTVGTFSSSWPTAYLVATVVLGIGLLIGSFMPASRSQQIAKRPEPMLEHQSTAQPQMNSVGRISGMVDCQWADPQTEAFNGANVPLGRKYALSSGLMEITYDTGAKVILQGPVTYEVESAIGGYLSLGKLTARVEKNEERRARSEELSASRSSFLIPHSYFAVRTPVAIVTDLGTEFGVEVQPDAGTTAVVLQGSVEIVSTLNDASPKRHLHAGQSVVVRNTGVVSETVEPEKSNSFVRAMPQSRRPQTFSISTAKGCGADAHVRDGDFALTNFGKQEELHTKYVSVGASRKVYLRFDLGVLADRKVVGAQLDLTINFNPIRKPRTFQVYGLKDGVPGDGRPDEGGWQEGQGTGKSPASEGVTWVTAPANQANSGNKFTNDAILLGEFEVTPEMDHGWIVFFNDKRLIEWLNSDTNGVGTLMLAWKDFEPEYAGMLPIFGSKEHAYLTPPTLTIRTVNDPDKQAH